MIDKAIGTHHGNFSKSAIDLSLSRAAQYRGLEKCDFNCPITFSIYCLFTAAFTKLHR